MLPNSKKFIQEVVEPDKQEFLQEIIEPDLIDPNEVESKTTRERVIIKPGRSVLEEDA